MSNVPGTGISELPSLYGGNLRPSSRLPRDRRVGGHVAWCDHHMIEPPLRLIS
jgi:hypothetical protein